MLREMVQLFLVLGVSRASFQEQSSPALIPPQSAHPSEVEGTVFSAGKDVSAPELIRTDLAIPREHGCMEVDGVATFSLTVDATGQPRDIVFLKRALGDLDKIALGIVSQDRFKPGVRAGVPVAVRVAMVVSMQTCAKEVKGEDGMKVSQLVLKSQPEQTLDSAMAPFSPPAQSGKPNRVGVGTSAPIPINNVAVEYSDKARKEKFQGICFISLIVDAQGMPQNVRVIRSLGHGLDEKAVEAVKKYRFKPATKPDGTPVAVQIMIEMNFRLY